MPVNQLPDAELIPIKNTERDDLQGDVIFVHGLNGNGREYWSPNDHPECFWPEWVGEDIEKVGVWSIGYSASAFAWQGPTMPLSQRVANIINLLQTNHLATERPVVFITHSLGGLLVKQMLQSADIGTVANAQSLVQQTKGIVFIATPHQGADLANFVDSLGFLLPTDLVDTLKRDQQNLIDLNTWFRNNFDRLGIQVQAFCETQPTSLGTKFPATVIKRIVVNCTSADPGLPNVNVVPLGKDHISICQLDSREDLLYKNVIPFIKQSLGMSLTINNGGEASGNQFDEGFESIIDGFLYGSVVPFLGAGVNLYNCFELTPIHLVQKLAEKDASLAQLMGIPCSVCPLHPSQLSLPDKCPVREGTAENSLSEPLSLEQRLSFSKMQLRFLADNLFLNSGEDTAYKRLRRLRREYLKDENEKAALAIKNKLKEKNNDWTVYQFLSRLPARMRLNNKASDENGGFPYQLIITTNYDDMLEQALEEMGESYDVVYYDTHLEKFIFESHIKVNEGYEITKVFNKAEYKLPLVLPDDLDPPQQRRIVILKLFGTWEGNFVVHERHFMRYWAVVLSRLDTVLPHTIRKFLRFKQILFLGCNHNDVDLELFWEAFLRDVKEHGVWWLIYQSAPGNYINKRWELRPNIAKINCSLEYFIKNLDARIEKL